MTPGSGGAYRRVPENTGGRHRTTRKKAPIVVRTIGVGAGAGCDQHRTASSGGNTTQHSTTTGGTNTNTNSGNNSSSSVGNK